MKRPLTLTGGILGIVGNAIFSILLIIGLYLVGGFMGNMIIIPILFLMIAITALILAIFVTIAYNKNAEVFKKRFGVIITSIVFNFIISVYLLITLFTTYGAYIIVYLILFGVVLTAAILNLVDICRENGKVKALNKSNITETKATQSKPAVATKPVQAKPSTETLESKLEKLKKMLDDGLIDEEEFKELKMNYIKQEINK